MRCFRARGKAPPQKRNRSDFTPATPADEKNIWPLSFSTNDGSRPGRSGRRAGGGCGVSARRRLRFRRVPPGHLALGIAVPVAGRDDVRVQVATEARADPGTGAGHRPPPQPRGRGRVRRDVRGRIRGRAQGTVRLTDSLNVPSMALKKKLLLFEREQLLLYCWV